MPHNRWIAMLVGLGMIGACSESDEGQPSAQNDNGTDFTVRSDEGETILAADGNSGRLSINMGGLEGSIKLPKPKLSGEDIDIDGVKLYPGAHVTGLDVAGQEGTSEGTVTIRFEADQPPETVSRYYVDAFRDKGIETSVSGNRLTGSDRDGKPFTIQLDKSGGGTRGVIRVGMAKG